MTEIEEPELLRRYVAHADESALAQIVRRRIGFVYSAARRQVRDPQLAEDVTQAVFILLTRKAHRIRPGASLAGWLFSVTRKAAANAIRIRARRHRHEQHAAQLAAERHRMNQGMNQTDDNPLLPLLDEALARLPAGDRSGVLLCCVDQLSHRQVGQRLGVSEEAARKRVTRALDRMRDFLAARGVTVTTPSIAIAITQSSTGAPFELIQSTLNVAALLKPSGPSAAIAKAVSHMILASKIKLAAACVAVAGVSLAVAGVAQRALTPLPVVALVAHQPADGTMFDLGDGVEVHFAGLARIGAKADEWFSLDGKPVAHPGAGRQGMFNMTPDPTHQMIVHVSSPPDASVNLRILGDMSTGLTFSGEPGDREYYTVFAPADGAETVGVELKIASGPWEPLDEITPQGDPDFNYATEKAQVGLIVSVSAGADGRSKVRVTSDMTGGEWRLVCYDDNGNELKASAQGYCAAGKMGSADYTFDAPVNSLARLVVESRPFNKTIVAGNITLDPAKPRKPEIRINGGK